jgi:hemerythrin-like domain-containing protein
MPKPTPWPALLALAFFLAAAAAAAAGNQPQTPTAILEKEHRVISAVVAAAEQEAAAIRAQGYRPERAAKFHDFFLNFTERCHHAKEERFYFPAAAWDANRRQKNLLLELETDHNRGRDLLAALEDARQRAAGDESARLKVAGLLESYADLLRVHMAKENQRLFPQVGPTLEQAQRREVLAGFAEIEHQELGEGFHEKYHALAQELKRGR